MAKTVNDKLAAEAIRRRIMLLRYGNNEAQDLIAILRAANPDITAAMLQGVEGMNANNMTPARSRALTNLVLNATKGAYANILETLSTDLSAFSKAETGYQANLLKTAIPETVLRLIDGEIVTATWQQVLAATTSRALMGQTIDQWFKTTLPTNMSKTLINAVQAGILQGTPSAQVIAQIRKSAVWGNQERDLATITHTAINSVAADARDMTLRENASMIKAREWLSTLDNKTSDICIVRDKLQYTVDVPVKPIGHTIPYGAGPGKIHWRCRSTETWVTKSYRELGIDMDELPEGTRASMDGQVPAGMNYMQFIEQASPRVQDEVLGVTRADMLRSGKYKASDFFDDGKRIPLSKLLELDKRDGIKP